MALAAVPKSKANKAQSPDDKMLANQVQKHWIEWCLLKQSALLCNIWSSL